MSAWIKALISQYPMRGPGHPAGTQVAAPTLSLRGLGRFLSPGLVGPRYTETVDVRGPHTCTHHANERPPSDPVLPRLLHESRREKQRVMTTGTRVRLERGRCLLRSQPGRLGRAFLEKTGHI